jgi:SAM-dependent methyltransferase
MALTRWLPGLGLAATRLRIRGLDHREAVGGLWEEMGEKQFAFMVEEGLRPEHTLLDIGCGSLRGGIHFIRYLDPGNYYGLDIQPAFLEGGRLELKRAGLTDRGATLVEDDAFRFDRLGCQFDYALAQSVFTHVPWNTIVRCLSNIESALVSGGRFYATYFKNPGGRLNVEPFLASAKITAFCDADPFYYEPDIFRWAVEGSSLRFKQLGDWGHSRNQQMLMFTKN